MEQTDYLAQPNKTGMARAISHIMKDISEVGWTDASEARTQSS